MKLVWFDSGAYERRLANFLIALDDRGKKIVLQFKSSLSNKAKELGVLHTV